MVVITPSRTAGGLLDISIDGLSLLPVLLVINTIKLIDIKALLGLLSIKVHPGCLNVMDPPNVEDPIPPLAPHPHLEDGLSLDIPTPPDKPLNALNYHQLRPWIRLTPLCPRLLLGSLRNPKVSK